MRFPEALRSPRAELVALAIAVLAVGLLALAGPGARAGLWTFRTGFTIMKVAAVLGAVGFSACLVTTLLPGRSRRGVLPLAMAVVLSVLAFAVPHRVRKSASAKPPIHDISTDLADPPAFEAVLPLRAGAPNAPGHGGAELAATQRAAYPGLAPLTLDVPPATALARAEGVARDMGWAIVAVDAGRGRIEVSDTTFWFGFIDDVVVRVTPSGAGARVDVRSVSRVGRGDAGANADRIERFLARMREGDGG